MTTSVAPAPNRYAAPSAIAWRSCADPTALMGGCIPLRPALRAVAALVLLARSAPAGVIAPDLLRLVDAALLDLGELLGVLLAVVVPILGRRHRRPGARGVERARLRAAASRVGEAAAARGRGGGPRLMLGHRRARGAVLALHLDLDVEDHPRE